MPIICPKINLLCVLSVATDPGYESDTITVLSSGFDVNVNPSPSVYKNNIISIRFPDDKKQFVVVFTTIAKTRAPVCRNRDGVRKPVRGTDVQRLSIQENVRPPPLTVFKLFPREFESADN